MNAINETEKGNTPNNKLEELNKGIKTKITNENVSLNNLETEKKNRCIIY